jgi:hypothetical protein
MMSSASAAASAAAANKKRQASLFQFLHPLESVEVADEKSGSSDAARTPSSAEQINSRVSVTAQNEANSSEAPSKKPKLHGGLRCFNTT